MQQRGPEIASAAQSDAICDRKRVFINIVNVHDAADVVLMPGAPFWNWYQLKLFKSLQGTNSLSVKKWHDFTIFFFQIFGI